MINNLALEELSKYDKRLIDSCLTVFHETKYDTVKINVIEFLIEECWDNKVWPKYNIWLLKFVKEKLSEHSVNIADNFLLSSLGGGINNIGTLYYNQGDIPKALEYYKKSLTIDKAVGDKKGIAISLNNIGAIYYSQGNIPLALDYYHKSLVIDEAIDDKSGIANCLSNIGVIYYNQGEYDKALKYYEKSLAIDEGLKNINGIANSLNNIGVIYNVIGDISKAMDFYSKSLVLRKEIDDKYGIANSLVSIGELFVSMGDTARALEYYYKSLAIDNDIADKSGKAIALYNIGELQLKQGALIDAKKSGLQSLTIAQEIGYPDEIQSAANLLSRVYVNQGKGLQALEMFQLHITMRDSINNDVTKKATIQQQIKYEYEKQKAIDDAEHNKLLVIEQENKEKQQILTIATAIGLGLVSLFLILIFNRLKITKKQKLVIEEQKEIVEFSHHKLEEKNREILDSITYAKRIQSAILPSEKVVKDCLQESFILYKPKDIVAGDFYWMERKDGKVLFAAADCTGHGVPGAMVSVICNGALNRSVREFNLTEPAQILWQANDIVIQEFEKSEEEIKDGMDIALCSIEGNKLQYAGAYNPLWIIRKGKLIETKAVRQSIGFSNSPKPYITHSFDLEKGDTIYIFSDGYVDQFGGKKEKKFKAKAFRELLLSIQDKNMKEQKTIIDEAFETWRGNLEQVDDVCVIGVRI